MRLNPAGVEYVRWTVTDAPLDAALEVSFDGTTWHPLGRDGDTVRVLLAGPDADPPPGAVVLTAGRNRATIRAADNPEVVIRDGGVIDVG